MQIFFSDLAKMSFLTIFSSFYVFSCRTSAKPGVLNYFTSFFPLSLQIVKLVWTLARDLKSNYRRDHSDWTAAYSVRPLSIRRFAAKNTVMILVKLQYFLILPLCRLSLSDWVSSLFKLLHNDFHSTVNSYGWGMNI